MAYSACKLPHTLYDETPGRAARRAIEGKTEAADAG
jgi:hypothetical protein